MTQLPCLTSLDVRLSGLHDPSDHREQRGPALGPLRKDRPPQHLDIQFL